MLLVPTSRFSNHRLSAVVLCYFRYRYLLPSALARAAMSPFALPPMVFAAVPGDGLQDVSGDGGNPTPCVRVAGPTDFGEKGRKKTEGAVNEDEADDADEEMLIYAATLADLEVLKAEAYANMVAAKLKKARAKIRAKRHDQRIRG